MSWKQLIFNRERSKPSSNKAFLNKNSCFKIGLLSILTIIYFLIIPR